MKWKARNRRKKRIHILSIAPALILSVGFIGIFCAETAFAAGEEMYFGSESYEWELFTSNPIGIYATADNNLESVDYTIVYDSDMMDYDGDEGELISRYRIQFESSDLSGNTDKRLLEFTPRVAGETRIYFRNAIITEEGGEPVSLDDNYVVVTIPIPSGCHLDEIYLDGTELPGFDTETAYYFYTLDEYQEDIEVTVEPDIGVTISSTHLSVGDNNIDILVENSLGIQARYRVVVTNPEKPVEPVVEEDIDEAESKEEVSAEETQEEIEEEEAEEEAEAEQIIAEEEEIYEEEEAAVVEETFLRRVSRMSSNFRVFSRNHTVIILIAVAAVIVVLFWWIVYLRSMRRHRRKTKEWKERNESKQEERNWKRTVKEAMETEDRPIEIIVSGITMDFKVEHDEPTSIKETVIRTLKRDRKVETFRALDNISFAVGEGEVVGIIGTNGSGKSTLLKIISGALIPTKGRVTVDRDKIQLLTLGTGFDYELTGRENVYLNGAIIGYSKEFIDEKYDDIVKFAELEGFMDEKVRNYSSGMVSRLGFAIATIRDTPEILILDEVLSVGDIFFRKKSEARIQEMIHGGSTVLIVSHSMGVIRKNCDKAIWIEKGELRMIGDPNEVCKAYENMENTEAIE